MRNMLNITLVNSGVGKEINPVFISPPGWRMAAIRATEAFKWEVLTK